MRRTGRLLTAALGIAFVTACPSPTLTLATQQPIEIKIDLRHEVRVHIDREVSDLIDSEAARERVLSRSGESGDEQLVRDAKRRGVVGEQADGYLGLRAGASEADRALVARINEARADEYAVLAQDYRSPVEEVARLAGANRIRAAGPGEWVQTPDGAWIDAGAAKVVVVEGGPDA